MNLTKKNNLKKNILFAFGFAFLYLVVLLVLRFSGQLVVRTFNASLIAVSINIANFAVATFLYKISIRKSNKTFLIYNLGGLSVRILMILAVIFYCLKFLNIEVYAFIFHFLIFYFLLQIVEIKIFTENK